MEAHTEVRQFATNGKFPKVDWPLRFVAARRAHRRVLSAMLALGCQLRVLARSSPPPLKEDPTSQTLDSRCHVFLPRAMIKPSMHQSSGNRKAIGMTGHDRPVPSIRRCTTHRNAAISPCAAWIWGVSCKGRIRSWLAGLCLDISCAPNGGQPRTVGRGLEHPRRESGKRTQRSIGVGPRWTAGRRRAVKSGSSSLARLQALNEE